MRLHILGIARNASTPTLTMDPYAMISYYTATYLHRAGHEVHYYGYKESTVECTKKWECGNKEFLEKYYITKGFEKIVGFLNKILSLSGIMEFIGFN